MNLDRIQNINDNIIELCHYTTVISKLVMTQEEVLSTLLDKMDVITRKAKATTQQKCNEEENYQKCDFQTMPIARLVTPLRTITGLSMQECKEMVENVRKAHKYCNQLYGMKYYDEHPGI